MHLSNCLPSEIASVEFSFLSSQEIRELSVKRITHPTTLDDLLHPIDGGLYDPALGAVIGNP